MFDHSPKKTPEILSLIVLHLGVSIALLSTLVEGNLEEKKILITSSTDPLRRTCQFEGFYVLYKSVLRCTYKGIGLILSVLEEATQNNQPLFTHQDVKSSKHAEVM